MSDWRRRDEKRREQEAERLRAEQLAWEKQSKCCHWECRVETWDFQGRPKKVVCVDCGAVNEPEHPE